MTLTPKQNELIKILASIVSRMMAEASIKEETAKLAVEEAQEK